MKNKPLRASVETSQKALDALNDDYLWPDLIGRRGKPLSDKSAGRRAQNARIELVKKSMLVARQCGVFL